MTADVLDEERIEVRIRLAMLRERGGDAEEIAALSVRVKELDRQIKAMRQGNQ